MTLVEREGELAALDELIAEAAAGAGRIVLIEGPAGVGKTELLVEARELARRGMAVLSARAGELEQEFPFGVVRQLFEGLLADPQERERLLAGAAEPAAAVFAAPSGAGSDGEPGGASFASLHGLLWLVLNLAEERPLLLAVDDLQWCDRPSLRFLAYLARRLEELPVLLAATQRSTDPGSDPALVGEIAHDPLTRTVRPGPLSAAGSREFVRGRLGDDADESFCAACHDSTGGNPLLLRQLLQALEADGVRPEAANAPLVRDIGPRAVSRTVLLRLARLPAETIAVARAVAVLGASADLNSVAALAEVDPRTVAEASGELARAEILRPEPPLRFVHPLVRDAVYHELPPAERELQHVRAAALLREAGAATDEVAAQLRHAPREGAPWVAELLREAGRAASRRGAPDSAVAYLRRALEEPPAPEQRPGLLLELGMVEAMTDAPAAIESLGEAYATHPDPAERLRAVREQVQILMFTPQPERAVELAKRVRAEVPDELADFRTQFEVFEHMAIYFGAAGDDTPSRFERHRGGIEGDSLGSRMLQSLTAWSWYVDNGPADACVRLARQALSDDVLLEGEHTFAIMGAQLVLVVADREDAMASWDRLRADAHRRGSLFSGLGVADWLGFTLIRRGELEAAERLLREALQLHASWGLMEGPATAYPLAHLSSVLRESGDLPGAQAALDQAPPSQRPSDGDNFVREARAELLLARGEPEAALEQVEELRAHSTHVRNPDWAPWRSLRARTLDRLGRREEAIALVEEELELARGFGAPRTVGRSLRVLGVLRSEEGIETLREAAELLEGSTARLERAEALTALGSALRRERKPSEAREPLRQALELASVCGAAPLAERARSELYAAGARPRAEALSGVESLTPSELRVAELAAGGDSNKDIAQTLYVTPKTIEVHLSSAYRKLGIRSRRELPAALG